MLSMDATEDTLWPNDRAFKTFGVRETEGFISCEDVLVFNDSFSSKDSCGVPIVPTAITKDS